MIEEREHLQKLIEIHRANLQHNEEKEAMYGLDCPDYVKNAKEEARRRLIEARARLAALEGGVPSAEPSVPDIRNNIMSELQETKAALADILEAVAVIRQIQERTGSATGTDLADDLTEALKGLAGDLNRLRGCHELRQHLRDLEGDFSLCHDEVRKPKNLMDIDIELIQILWEKCKKNSFYRLVQFIKWYSSTESDNIIEVENWLDDLCIMRKSIDNDLREGRLGPLKESTNRFGSLVDQYSAAADRHLEDIIAKLCDQVSQYMGRISK
jgi:hypothetical protein